MSKNRAIDRVPLPALLVIHVGGDDLESIDGQVYEKN